MTNFIIEHQCPQCGAPAELEETDRLFHCPFCKVNSYLSTNGYFRYIIPHRAPAGKEIVYFPYWRFKGMLFTCTSEGIAHRFLDVSQQARQSSHFPINMGFRGQTQKLRFAATEKQGHFIKPDLGFKTVLAAWQKQYSMGLSGSVLHQDQIGETVSILYAPFYLEARVMDGVLNEAFSAGKAEDIPEDLLTADTPNWPIQFLATLCPQCGWDLKGQRDSLALDCSNCQTVWWSKKGKLTQLNTAHMMEDTGDDWVYLPFWRIEADVSHIQLESYADLIQVANLPRVVQPGWDQQAFRFWSPAFKVRPQKYLNLATRVTLSQPAGRLVPGNPKGDTHAVSLPLQEAVESLKLNLANFMKPQQRMAKHIHHINIKARRFLLVYLPFQKGHHELIQPKLQLTINRNTLALAKHL